LAGFVTVIVVGWTGVKSSWTPSAVSIQVNRTAPVEVAVSGKLQA
jgi:hypothetical protein